MTVKHILLFSFQNKSVSHVTKRMGTGLRALVRDYKGKYLGAVYMSVGPIATLTEALKPNIG